MPRKTIEYWVFADLADHVKSEKSEDRTSLHGIFTNGRDAIARAKERHRDPSFKNVTIELKTYPYRKDTHE